MTLNDSLATVMAQLKTADALGQDLCYVKPATKLALKLLEILQDKQYIGSFEIIEDGKGNHIKINLLGKINGCGVIKPRFSVQKTGYTKFEKRYLPARDFGLLLVSTSQGVVTHQEAFAKGLGGKLLAYCY